MAKSLGDSLPRMSLWQRSESILHLFHWNICENGAIMLQMLDYRRTISPSFDYSDHCSDFAQWPMVMLETNSLQHCLHASLIVLQALASWRAAAHQNLDYGPAVWFNVGNLVVRYHAPLIELNY